MADYHATIEHNETTVRLMARAQFDAFRPKSFYFLLFLALALLAAAVFVPGLSQQLKILCIVFGSFLIVGLNSPPRQLADQIIRSLNGRFPVIRYSFGEESAALEGTDTADTLHYNEIIRLVEQKDYLYLFIRNRSAYMIDRSTAEPDDEGLMAFLEKKTGLAWTRNRSIWNTSLKSIREQNRNTK